MEDVQNLQDIYIFLLCFHRLVFSSGNFYTQLIDIYVCVCVCI